MSEVPAPVVPDVPAPGQVQVQIPDIHADILYSDQAFVFFTPAGFTLDFAQLTPQAGTSRVVARVGMSPVHLKLLGEVLAQNLKRYEDQFGIVTVTPQMVAQHNRQTHPFGFHPGAAAEPTP